MDNWNDKYLSIYGKLLNVILDDMLDEMMPKKAQKQNDNPLASVVIASYEDYSLADYLWSWSELQTLCLIGTPGMNNNSKDKPEEVYFVTRIFSKKDYYESSENNLVKFD